MTNHSVLPSDIAAKFDCYNWRNALEILKAVHPVEWEDVQHALQTFELKHSVVIKKGGNKSAVAIELDTMLYARGWVEKSFDTQILVDKVAQDSPTHGIDCFKNRVALEVEWNNKDPFFDRDLNNFRLLYDLHVIDVGVILTRTTALQKWLLANHVMLLRNKDTYGPSTTHFEKLKPKIDGGGAGGCPVVVFSIRREAYVDDR